MNIAICGTVGSGKTTVAKELARQMNAEYISGGTLFRQYAKEHGMTLQQMNDSDTSEIDKILDGTIYNRSSKEDNLVVEARYSGKFCCNSKKIFLYCDPTVAAKRIYSDSRESEKYGSDEECLSENIRRMYIERNRGLNKYQFDMLDMSTYDLVLDTTHLSPEQALSYLDKEGIYLFGDNMIPTQTLFDVSVGTVREYMCTPSTMPVQVFFKSFQWYISNGHHRTMAHMFTQPYVPIHCELTSSCQTYISPSALYDFEDYGKFKYNTYPKEIEAMISTELLANVKAVLFGNQKQANVINESVVAIVAQFLDSNSVDMSTQDSVAEGIYMTLKECAEYGINKENEVFVQLVAGPKSYQVLKDAVPYVVSYDQPSVDSPKYNFRIYVVGEEDVEAKIDSELPEVKHVQYSKPSAMPDEVIDPNDTLADQVRKLKDAILPMAPTAYRNELSDDYAIALACAKDYFELASR